MDNQQEPEDAGERGGQQFREMFHRLEQVLLDGLRHGHFRFSISGNLGNGKQREVFIEAGKTDKYTFPEDEIPR